MMVAQFAFLFLARQTTCQKSSTEMDVKTSDVIVKHKSTKMFHGLYSCRP